MASKTIPLTAVSIQSTSANKQFGEPALPPIGTAASNNARLLLRGAVNSLIPANATISNAKLQVWMKLAWSGSRTVVASAVTSSWSTNTVWGGTAGTPPNRPTTTTTNQASVTQSGTAADGLWEFDVTAIAQQWLSGALVNNGIQLASTSTSLGIFRGRTSAKLQPVLVVTYLVAGEAPAGLSPSGVVGITKPVLRGQVPSDTIATQWQIDPSGVFTSPTFDSGEVAGSAGYFDLAGSSYGGNTASTQWRMRYKTALGWQPWSAATPWSYVGYGSFAFTSPGTTSEDPSPPIAGTATPESGATVTGWRAVTLDTSGNLLEDSGNRTGAIAYGPTKSYAAARVDVFTSTVREATPGDPGYLRSTRTFTVAQSGSVSAYTSPAASNNGVSPAVTVTATRSAIPDEVAVYRRAATDTSMGTLVVRGPGTTYMSGTALTVNDWSAPMNQAWVYDVYAITGGTAWSAKATTTALTPSCKGVWVYNPTDGSSVALWSQGDVAEARTEQVTVFQTVSGQAFARRIAGGAKTGEFSGFSFLDALGTSGAPMAVTWLAWQALGVDTVFRLVVGNKNLGVQLWNLDTRQRPENGPSQFIEDAVGNWLAVA